MPISLDLYIILNLRLIFTTFSDGSLCAILKAEIDLGGDVTGNGISKLVFTILSHSRI